MENCTKPFDIATYQHYVWIFVVKSFIGFIVVAENFIVFMAIIQKWKTIIRQQNLYRYVMSLVAADLLNGVVLLLHSVFWIVAISKRIGIEGESPAEVIRNFVTGILFGLTFASLSSAALLNLVLRVTSTRALARAAAIKSRASACFSRGSWVRSPRITIALIMLIWMVTLVFVILPLPNHCEGNIQHCVSYTDAETNGKYFVKMNGSVVNETEFFDCSVLQTPNKRSYVLVLNIFIIMAWILMVLGNFFTTCVKTEVQKSSVMIDGRSHLELTRRFGFSTDTSSIFAMIITLNMTISTLPYVIFSFITEGGPPYNRVYYGLHINPTEVEIVEMTTYISSIVNPFIYTTLLSRLRGDVLRILKWHRQKSKQIMKLQNENKL